MPKDTQIDPMSKRNRTTLRELSHIRRHNGIYCPELENHSGSMDSFDADAAMDTMETCFSALILDASEKTEGNECAGSRSSNSELELENMPMTGVQNLSSEQSPTISEPSLPVTPAGHAKLTLVEGSKDNTLLQRRILVLERRERNLRSQIAIQKRAVTSLAKEAEGARRLLAMAEKHFQTLEHTVEKLKDENGRFWTWWLRENRAVKDLLGFVADPKHPTVAYITSTSRARFADFYSEVEY